MALSAPIYTDNGGPISTNFPGAQPLPGQRAVAPEVTHPPPVAPVPSWAGDVRTGIRNTLSNLPEPQRLRDQVNGTVTPSAPAPAVPAWAAGAVARAKAGNSGRPNMAGGGPVYRRGYADGGAASPAPTYGMAKQYAAQHSQQEPTWGGSYAPQASSPGPAAVAPPAAPPSGGGSSWGGGLPVLTPQSIAPQQQQGSAPAPAPAAQAPTPASTTSTGNDGFVYSNPFGQNNFEGTPWRGTPSYVNGNSGNSGGIDRGVVGGAITMGDRGTSSSSSGGSDNSGLRAMTGTVAYKQGGLVPDRQRVGYAEGGPVKPKPRAPGEGDTVYDSTATAWGAVDPYQASMAQRDDAPASYAEGGPVSDPMQGQNRSLIGTPFSGNDVNRKPSGGMTREQSNSRAGDDRYWSGTPGGYAEGGEVEDIDTGPDIDTGYAAGGRDPTLDYAMGGSDQDAVEADGADPQDPQDQQDPQKPQQPKKKPFKPKVRRPKPPRMARGRRRRPASQVTGYAAGGPVQSFDDGGYVDDANADVAAEQQRKAAEVLAEQQRRQEQEARTVQQTDQSTAKASPDTDRTQPSVYEGAKDIVKDVLNWAREKAGIAGEGLSSTANKVPTEDLPAPSQDDRLEDPYYGNARQHTPRNQPGKDEPSADSSTFSLAGQAAQKGLESAGRSVADFVTGFFKNPPGAVDVDVAGALGSANDAIKQKLLDYINGTDGHPPEVSQATVEKLKTEHGLDHNDASHKAIIDHVNAGDMDSAAKQMQGYKQVYEPIIQHAQGAANQGDLQEAARLATEAHQHVPDNRKVTYEVTPGKNVLATINDGTDTPKYATLTAQQFHDYLVGPGTNFDHQIENGIEKNLDIAARQPEAPEHAGQIRMERPATGYGGDERQAPRQEETPRTTGYGGNGGDDAMVRPTPNAGTDQGIVQSTPNAGTDQGILRPAPNASPANLTQARDTADRVLSAPATAPAQQQINKTPYTEKELYAFGFSGQDVQTIQKAGGFPQAMANHIAPLLPKDFFKDPKNMANLEAMSDTLIRQKAIGLQPAALESRQASEQLAQSLLDKANNPNPTTPAPGSKLGIPTGVDAPLVPKEIEQARNMPELKVMQDPGLLQHLPEGYFNAPEGRAALARVQEHYSGYGGGMARVFPNTESGNKDLANHLLWFTHHDLYTGPSRANIPTGLLRQTDVGGREVSQHSQSVGKNSSSSSTSYRDRPASEFETQLGRDQRAGNIRAAPSEYNPAGFGYSSDAARPGGGRRDTAYERAQRGPTDYRPSSETLDQVGRALGVPQQPGASRPEPQPGTPGYIRPDDPRLYKQPPSQPARPEVGTLSTDPRRQGPESRLDDQPPSWPRPGPQGEATYPGGLKMVPTTDPRYRNLVGPNGETIGSSVPANRDLAPHEVNEMYYKHNQQQAENRLRLGDPVAVQALTVDRNKLYQPLPPPQQPTAESRAIARDYLVKNNIIHPDSPILGGGGAGGGNISSQPPRPTGNKLQDDYNFKVWQQQRIAETSQASRQQQASIAASRDMTVHQQQELINIREAKKAGTPLTPIQKQIDELHQQKTLELMQGGGGQGGGSIRVNSVQEAMQLPHGTHIILPDGSPGVVP